MSARGPFIGPGGSTSQTRRAETARLEAWRRFKSSKLLVTMNVAGLVVFGFLWLVTRAGPAGVFAMLCVAGLVLAVFDLRESHRLCVMHGARDARRVFPGVPIVRGSGLVGLSLLVLLARGPDTPTALTLAGFAGAAIGAAIALWNLYGWVD